MDNPTLFEPTMLKGTVEVILFQNQDNFYTVLKVDTIESNESFDTMPTVVGFSQILLKATYTPLKDRLLRIQNMANN